LTPDLPRIGVIQPDNHAGGIGAVALRQNLIEIRYQVASFSMDAMAGIDRPIEFLACNDVAFHIERYQLGYADQPMNKLVILEGISTHTYVSVIVQRDPSLEPRQ